jgi:cytochrome oxidase Cu insertion factor (SCO1/SenC/PrrC family)
MSRINTLTSFYPQTVRGGREIGLLVLLLAALVLVFTATSITASTASTSTAMTGQVKKKPISEEEIERARNYFTDTEMTTQAGQKVRFYSDMLDGHVVVVNAMYTNCKGACPLITQKLLAVSRELGDLFGDRIHFVSVSNDAERDTPEALSEFAGKQGADLAGWTFLTGDKARVDGVLKKIGLYQPIFEQHKSTILIGNTRTGHWQKVRPDMPHQAIAVKLKELAAEG